MSTRQVRRYAERICQLGKERVMPARTLDAYIIHIRTSRIDGAHRQQRHHYAATTSSQRS